MEIFGEHWTDHAAKVAANWHQLIRSDDTVIICGDTSWAMDLQDALTDLTGSPPCRAQNHSARQP